MIRGQPLDLAHESAGPSRLTLPVRPSRARFEPLLPTVERGPARPDGAGRLECIGKGKAHKPYEFGVKVSVATPLNRCRGGQFVAHVKALPGNPYDGHTLAAVLPDIESTIGAGLERIVTDAG